MPASKDEQKYFHESDRMPTEDNAGWVERHLRKLAESIDEVRAEREDYPESPTHLLLIGGRTATDFRLRVAQAPFRHDATPSHWSHVAIIKSPNEEAPAATVLLEVSLEPPLGLGTATHHNGLQTNYLDWYADPERYPNVALLQVPVPQDRWAVVTTALQTSPLELFAKQRRYLDVPALILRWLSFLWWVGDGANPLLEGAGLPSASAVEALLDAEGYDISPGLESGASSPEAIWQAASWWHPFYELHQADPILGYFTCPDTLDFVPSQFQPDERHRDLWLDPLDKKPQDFGMMFRFTKPKDS